MLLAAVDLTNVLDTLIVTIPAIIAALYARNIKKEITTPSGPSIGKQVEAAHVTAIANNHFLSAAHGQTHDAPADTLEKNGDLPPQMPNNDTESH